MENFILPIYNYSVQFMHNAKDVIENNISNPELRKEIINNMHPIYAENNKTFNEIKVITNIVFDIISNHYDSLQVEWDKTIGPTYVKNLKEFVFNSGDNKNSKTKLLEKYGINYDFVSNKFTAEKSKYNLSLEDRIVFYVLDNYNKILKYNVRKIYSNLYKENISSTSEAINILSKADAIHSMTNTLLTCNRLKEVSKKLMSEESAVFTKIKQINQNSDAWGYVVRGRKVKVGTKFKLNKQTSNFGKYHSRKTPSEIAFKIYDENNNIIDNWEHTAFNNVVICNF